MDFLRLGADNAVAQRVLVLAGRQHARRLVLQFDRLLLARHDLFGLGAIVDAIIDQLGRLRILALDLRHNFARRGIGLNDRRRLAGAGVIDRAIGEGTGGADHRERKDGDDGDDADAAAAGLVIVVDVLGLPVLMDIARVIAARLIIRRLRLGVVGTLGVERVGLARGRSPAHS